MKYTAGREPDQIRPVLDQDPERVSGLPDGGRVQRRRPRRHIHFFTRFPIRLIVRISALNCENANITLDDSELMTFATSEILDS
jgi:hypothetical protein